MLYRVLSNAFPELADTAASDQCWVATAIRAHHPGLALLLEATGVFDLYGEVISLQAKPKREHPSHREHNPDTVPAFRIV